MATFTTKNVTVSDNDIITEINQNYTNEAIAYFSEIHYNKSQDSERYFYKKSEWEYVISQCNSDLIESFVLQESDGSVWCYGIRPKYQKKVRTI